MKFRVSRTSDRSAELPPCDGAYLDVRGHERTNKWAIEIDSLESFIKLINIVGEIVVCFPCKYNDFLPSIEIYDTFRE